MFVAYMILADHIMSQSAICKTLHFCSLKRLAVLAALLVVSAFAAPFSSAQQVGVKTNLLYDATATINLGAEVRVAPRWSIDLSGNLNAWNLGSERRWKHWLIQPEARYWLCEATTGHFFALNALGGKFNVGHVGFAHNFLGTHFSHLSDHRYQGSVIGTGIGYGYSWLLGRHWNIEAEATVGLVHGSYDIFECAGCGRRVGHNSSNHFLPTKLAVNVVYVF